MPDDFVTEIYPLNQIRAVSPHPANVREERRNRQKKGSRQRQEKRKEQEIADRVSLKGKEERPDQSRQESRPSATDSPEAQKVQKSIDITV